MIARANTLSFATFAACLALAAPAYAQHGQHGQPPAATRPAPARPAPPRPRPRPAPPAAAAPAPVAPAETPVAPAPAEAAPTQQAAPVIETPAPMPMMQQDAQHLEGMQHHATMSRGLYGAYAMGRDASGTSWQPDVSTHGGLHAQRGEWMLMGHALLNGVYSWQDGPRGDDKAFAAGMIMGAARRDFASGGTLSFRAMVSPDPFMGRSGYPLLLAAGETADGVTELTDRQHPHELFMELAASYAHPIGPGSAFIYAGLPGEPAFGPPAFMHRLSAMDSPEAPITHHWLDSTHITFGVVTAGYVIGPWKIEASRFRGREPNQGRYDIEEPRLDSTAVRVSVNPTERLALQVSWADVTSPEQLHPDEDDTRWSASAIYARPVGEGLWSTTLAFGRKQHDGGDAHDAWLLESAYAPNTRWTVFGRFEHINTEALGAGAQDVARASLGAIRDFQVSPNARLGLGVVLQHHLVGDALEPAYDGDPNGAMAFVRLKIG